jgi:hypothetical protein
VEEHFGSGSAAPGLRGVSHAIVDRAIFVIGCGLIFGRG